MKSCSFPKHCLLSCIWLLALLVLPLQAHEGHDHGPAIRPVEIGVLPRFEAQGEMFEVVGVLDGDTLLLYLDRFDNNLPVQGATIEVDGPQLTGVATEQDAGVYRIAAPALQVPGKYPLALTIHGAGVSDLLAAELQVLGVSRSAAAGSGSLWPGWPWFSILAGLSGVGLILFFRRFSPFGKVSGSGGAA